MLPTKFVRLLCKNQRGIITKKLYNPDLRVKINIWINEYLRFLFAIPAIVFIPNVYIF